MSADPQQVLDFWLGDGATLDAQIRERFGALVERAVDGGLADWKHAGIVARFGQ